MHRHRRRGNLGGKVRSAVLVVLLALSFGYNPPPWWWWAALVLTLAWTAANATLPDERVDDDEC